MTPSALILATFFGGIAVSQGLRPTRASGIVPVLYPAENPGLPDYSFPNAYGTQVNAIANELAGAVQSWFSTVTTGADYAAYVSDLPPEVASDIEAATNVADLTGLTSYPTSFWSTFPQSAKSYHSEVWEAQRSFVMAAATSLGGIAVPYRPSYTSYPSIPTGGSNGAAQSASIASSNNVMRSESTSVFLLAAAVSVGLLAFFL